MRKSNNKNNENALQLDETSYLMSNKANKRILEEAIERQKKNQGLIFHKLLS